MEQEIQGLSEQEAKQRAEEQQKNRKPAVIGKSTGQIIRDNTCTLFHLLNGMIAILLFSVKAYSNMAFLAIIILNSIIGIVQELKAKCLVEQLSVLNRPRAVVLRDGAEREVDISQVVKADVMVLESGRQICCDAVVLSGSIEVNESLLTGESDALVKGNGDELLSGSSVVCGRCYAKVVHAGEENYAERLTREVQKAKNTDSELFGSMRQVTRFTSVLIVPLGILMLMQAFLVRGESAETAVVSSAAALLGMLPKGLVLLITVSLAAGVARLAKKKILVQNLSALETLAHVDVLCLDKTGTITNGNLTLKESYLLTNPKEVTAEDASKLLRRYLEASDDCNATAQALRQELTGGKKQNRPGRMDSGYEADGGRSGDKTQAADSTVAWKCPFSSKRKWGAVSFAEGITVFVGAPERLLQEECSQETRALEMGNRVVAAAYYRGIWQDAYCLPPASELQPLYLFTLSDTIRPHTKDTLDYFKNQGVAVKVISGDHIRTVSQVAKRAGLEHWQDAVDLSMVNEETADYGALCEQYTVFARVTPRQKQKLVAALKHQGHHVAMTGDGVNDLLAMREADCAIAVAEGSDASRQLAQIVLLESDFTHLPQVVDEGRRVIHNVTRTAGVFFIKTVYSLLLSIFCLMANIPFPFIPIQITLVDACIEAFPSFVTILEADTSPVRGRFLTSALKRAVPFALTITGTILFLVLFTPFSGGELHTAQYLILILFSLAAVCYSCIPFTMLRGLVCIGSAVSVTGALLVVPGLLKLQPLSGKLVLPLACAVLLGFALLALLLGIQRRVELFKEQL